MPSETDASVHTPAPRPKASALRAARAGLAAGENLSGTGLGPALARSWQRSREAGLTAEGRGAGGAHASAAQLARAVERSYELLSHARPVMEHLLPHVQASGGLILLADARGTVVASLGDDGFAGRARRVALRPGAQWSEALRGTNAIGTALAEDAPVTIHGGEHYLSRNGFLSCSAAPIHDPTGALLGVVDITGDQRAQHPATLPHVLGLACTAARMIEHRLFETWHAQALRLRFHARREGLGMLDEGLLAVSPEGQLLGANSVARELLGIARAAQGRWRVDTGLGLGVQTLFDWARCGQPQELADASGTRRWWRVDAAPQALRLVIDAGVEAASGGADAGVDGHGPAHPRAAPALERLMQVCNGDATEARRRWGLGVGSGYAQSNISPCETSALTIRPRVPEGARHTDRHPQGPDS